MTRENTLVWSWLGVLTKKRYDVLQDVYGNLDEALGHMSEELLKSLGCREETVWKTLNRLEEFDPSAYDQELKKRDLHLLSIEDASYPEALRTLPDPPVFLMYRGDLTILSQPCIALVGTRNMSSYGKRVVEEFVPAFVSAGMVTVSGLALGIDTYVAQQTIALSGRTVAVLGHGMAQIFPRSNARLAEQIVENGGLLLSEFPLDSAPDKYTFPARNRIIAGLSLGTVVLEAGEGSGALITADLALDYGREVFAVPGQIFDEHYAGCHAVIARSNASLVSSAQDVLMAIGIHAQEEQKSTYEPADVREKALIAALTTMPQSVRDVVERSKLSVSDTNATLTMLELNGAAKNVGNGMWVRS